ncbi:MAG: YbhB/YbcL family Raf kinase inhibitor-like protein [Candidatus Absconditabacterales bacterium]
MRKRILFVIIIACVLTLVGIRFFSPEDTRICDGDTIVKHGNPSINGSGFFCSGGKLLEKPFLSIQDISMKISTDFIDNGLIPFQYTCDGEGRFPILKIDDLLPSVKSLALVVDDPDSTHVRDHLLLANIPYEGSGALVISQDTFDLGILGQNSWGELAWGAPCPPSGTHRYVFKVYALSQMLEISSGFSKERLMELMGGKIIARSQIVGLYKRE